MVKASLYILMPVPCLRPNVVVLLLPSIIRAGVKTRGHLSPATCVRYILCRAMYGCVWLCTAICMAMHGYEGLCRAVYGCVWLCRAKYGNVGLCRAIYAWLCMAMYGCLGLCRAV